MADHGVGLADAIEGLRQELQQAIEIGREERLRFSLSPIELTLQVAVTVDGNGKIGWRVIEVGGSIERERTQTIKLTLDPGFLQEDGTYLSRTQWTVASQSTEKPNFGTSS